jgi:hypothetical protein
MELVLLMIPDELTIVRRAYAKQITAAVRVVDDVLKQPLPKYREKIL